MAEGSHLANKLSTSWERVMARDGAPRSCGSPIVSLRVRQRRFAFRRPSTRKGSEAR